MSRVVSSLFVLFVLVAPVRAQVCGNGVLELGEQCDDGNLVAGDCCSPACVRGLAGQPCRASVHPCDVIEVCDGVAGVCPADSGILGDGDGDGLCDPLDSCPAAFNPGQLDRDFDGLGDACDPCTNVSETEVTNATLRLRKLDLPFGLQRVKIRGDLTVAPSPPIDPIANGLRLVVTDETGLVSLDVTLPGGLYDSSTRRGWTASGAAATLYRYTDREATVGGIKRVLVKQRVPGQLHVVAFGQDGGYYVPASEVVDVAIVADPPHGETQCGEGRFGQGRCRYRNRGGKLVCR